MGGKYLFLFQIANHSGYVQVDWRKVEKDVNKAKKHLKKNANKAAPELNSFIEEVGILYIFVIQSCTSVYKKKINLKNTLYYHLVHAQNASATSYNII